MKEESIEQQEPIESSSLPLATIGSSAPLVIDLPDGQKLVVGNLDPGTVIEVATWRGTGRPDSRTNRLMLGVSSAEEEVATVSKDFKPALYQVKSEDDVEVTQANKNSLSYTVTSPRNVEEQIQRVPRLGNKLNKRFLVQFTVLMLIVGLLCAGLIGPGKLRIAHPLSGVSTSLGSAENSLVIIKRGTAGQPGDPVLADTSEPANSPIVAIVAAIDGTNYLLATNDGQIQTTSERVRGKVYFVIPFLGVLATLISK